MINHTVKIKKNTFFINKNQNKKFPSSIVTFFFIMQLIFGFNFGFVHVLNKNIRYFYKTISLLICLYNGVIILLCTPVLASERNIKVLFGSLCFVHYCGHFILLNFTKYKVYDFITDIRSIDDRIIHSKEHKLGWFACVVFGCWFTIIVSFCVIFCMVKNIGCVFENKLVSFMYEISLSGLDATVFVQLMANFYTYNAVTYLVGLVEKEKTSLIKKQFLHVSESCEKFGGYYGSLAVLDLLVHLTRFLAMICSLLNTFKENGNWEVYTMQVSFAIYITFQMCAPAVTVEAINKQMESLRFKLYARLMEEKDVEKHLELSSFLRYMELKPLYSQAWRIIPADIKLVVALFGFITTYVIVILQFMHFY